MEATVQIMYRLTGDVPGENTVLYTWYKYLQSVFGEKHFTRKQAIDVFVSIRAWRRLPIGSTHYWLVVILRRLSSV